MKATLKHVANQYILIVDERPKIGEYYYRTQINIRKCIDDSEYDDNDFKIIAAENLEGVKGIKLDYKNLLEPFIGIESLIDTEVEVTEEEDYYLIRL